MLYALFYKYARLALPRGRALHAYKQELMQTQWLKPDELQALQLNKIKRLVKHAYFNVPFYKARFDELGLHPNDIKTFDDFHQIPPITRLDVKNNYDAFIATNFPRRQLQSGLTGGSTGEPMKYYQTPDGRIFNWAVVQRNRTWIGFEEGMKQAWLWGRDEDVPTFWQDRFWSWLRRQKWLTSYNMSEERMADFARQLIRFQPEFIFGYASSVYLFAQYLEKKGITAIRPKVVQTASEKLYRFQRELIERVFDCPVSDHYAAMEVSTIADECLQGGLHISAEARYVEVTIDDKRVGPGTMGEITVTDLTNFAMPLIRYKGGDLAVLDDRVCSCGRNLPLLREVVGRTADFFKMPSGKLVSGLYWTLRMREVPGIRRFRVHQFAVDKIEVTYETEAGFDSRLLEAKRIEILARLNEPLQLTFRQVDQIPPTRAGKHLFITSDVPIDFSPDNISA